MTDPKRGPRNSKFFRTVRMIAYAVDRRGGYVLPREPGFYEASVWCNATKTWHHSGTVSRLELLDWANCLEMLRQPV